MSKRKLFSPLVFALVVTAALALYLFMPKQADNQNRQRPPTPVKLQSVKHQQLPIIVSALGTAKANESVTITAQETDTINKILFDDGDLVDKDQPLVYLTAEEEKARVNELKINLKEAKRQLKRIEELAHENVASVQLLDEQQARVDSLTAQLEVTKSKLRDRSIKAPFSGLLGVRQVSIGALVRPGEVITTLDDLSTIKVDFNIAEEHLPSIANQQPITATTIAYPDRVFSGTISNVSSRVDPVTRAVHVRALVTNPDLALRPGMLLKVTVKKQTLDALIVSESALVPIEDKQYVYRVDNDNVARQVEVKIGVRRPGLVQIVEGLNDGDKVVVEGTLRLQDGSKVNPVEG